MKFTLQEYEHGFQFSLTPETLEDVAILTRMSMNASQDKVRVTTYFNMNRVSGEIHFNKKKRTNSSVSNNERRK